MNSRCCVLLLAVLACCVEVRAGDPLPSWNSGERKTAIIDFVTSVTDKQSPGYVPPTERIAVFDNDGTLWCEQPMYVEAFFMFDRIKELAPQHPEWQEREPFASVLKGDTKAALAGGRQSLVEMIMATHAGMTAEEFSQTANKWLATARHPKTGKPFTSMVYQPMLELLSYLRANEFKVFIVTGGGIDFVRVFSEPIYGIPRERVVGSSVKAKYELRDGVPVIIKLPEIDLVDDKAGKPVGIHRYIGRRPIAAFGNSDGDYEMLCYTTKDAKPRLGMIVHHTDAEREYAYDRDSLIGRLDKALDDAKNQGWQIIDMKHDWKQVFPN